MARNNGTFLGRFVVGLTMTAIEGAFVALSIPFYVVAWTLDKINPKPKPQYTGQGTRRPIQPWIKKGSNR